MTPVLRYIESIKNVKGCRDGMPKVFKRGIGMIRCRDIIDQGEVEAMKTPIGCRAPRCDKDQFRAKMTVST